MREVSIDERLAKLWGAVTELKAGVDGLRNAYRSTRDEHDARLDEVERRVSGLINAVHCLADRALAEALKRTPVGGSITDADADLAGFRSWVRREAARIAGRDEDPDDGATIETIRAEMDDEAAIARGYAKDHADQEADLEADRLITGLVNKVGADRVERWLMTKGYDVIG